MAKFPNELVESIVPLPIELMRATVPAAAEAVGNLEEQGFLVRADWNKTIIEHSLGDIANQPHIVEYCPEDRGIATPELARERLATGMASFILLHPVGWRARPVAGYGWVQNGRSEHVRGGVANFGIRIAETALQRGLAVEFGRAMLGAVRAQYDVRTVWGSFLESNRPAANTARSLGFRMKARVAEERTVNGKTIDDRRIYADLRIGNLRNPSHY